MPAPKKLTHGIAHPTSEKGVVLVITLILIVVLSLLGTFAIRNANQTERVVNGVRTSQVAQEAAETALRFCEQIVHFSDAGKDYTEYGTTNLKEKVILTNITSEQDTNAEWRTASNWIGNNVIDVPDAYVNKYKNASVDPDASPLAIAPKCLIQRIRSSSTPPLVGYLITARGFANNANYDTSTGKTTNGAEAWMQSILIKS
ncbi:pilus assembly PilX family protein [Ottowia thiooxydans]|uniref:pilus assembly PilX family protein n=1 Tax=Ottowia thiooxydans TaxID=219182 RepID=UPI000422E0BA|nr:PilX N-terminal domain-containing pilus assembly protein [Ottowia thiooxydans]